MSLWVTVAYYYLVDPQLSAWWASSAVPNIVWQWQMAIHVVESFALAFLAWTAWD